MGKRKQPKPDQPVTVMTEVEEDHYRIKNWVAKEWLPIIGPHANALYCIYSAAANRELGNKWYFSIRTLEEFTMLSNPTILMNNWLLELCGLIRVNPGDDIYANEYVILPPPHVTPEILKPIVAMLKEPANVGKNWQAFKANALERIMKWKPLHECGKVSQFKKIQVEAGQPQLAVATNNPAPQPTPAAPSQVELVAALVATFKNDKSPLTESAAEKMITDYGVAAVKQQLAWLPARQSDTPLRILRAALKGNWDEPKAVGHAQTETFTPTEKAAMMANSQRQGMLCLYEADTAPETTSADSQWQEVKERLQMQLPQATFDSWVKQTQLVSITGNQWLIQCASTLAQELLEYRLNGTLTRTASSVAGQAVELKFIVKE